jgi:MFS family permease
MDARGRRGVVLAGVALQVSAVGLYLTIDALGLLVYGIRLLDGMAMAMWYTALFTYAADLVPAARRTEGLAIFGISGLIPIGLAAVAGDVILAYSAYRALFAGALVFAFLGAIVCLPLRDVHAPHREQHMPARGVLATAAERDLLPIWPAALAFFVPLFALFSFIKTFVIATGIGSVGGFFGAYASVAVALRVFLGWLPDRLGPRHMLGAAMGSFAGGLVVLSMADTTAHVVAAGLLCGAGHGYAFPILFGLVVGRARPQERGAAAAFFTTLDWVGLLIAGPAVGVLIERVGYSGSFIGLALLLGLGYGLFYGLDVTRSRPQHDK